MLRRSTVCNGHGEPRSALRQESELVGRRGLEPRTSAVGPAERCTNEIESLGAGCPSYAVRPRPILSPKSGKSPRYIMCNTRRCTSSTCGRRYRRTSR